MATAAAATGYRSNIGHDFTSMDAYDPEYLNTETAEDEDETAARQALNARMAEWYGIA
jgi:hypothetical protein